MATAITVTVDAVNYVFNPDSQQQDAVKYLNNGSTLVLPWTLRLRRVYPKKQKTFPGVARNIVTTSRTFSYADGLTNPIVIETSFSRRADSADADLTLLRKIHAAALVDSELDGFISHLSL